MEKAIQWFMPALFILLIVLLIYSFNSGGFAQGWAFMFDLKWDAVGPEAWLDRHGPSVLYAEFGYGHHDGLWGLRAQ